MSFRIASPGYRGLRTLSAVAALDVFEDVPSLDRIAAARVILALPGARTALVAALDDPHRRGLILQIAGVQVMDAEQGRWHASAVEWMRTANAGWQESAGFCAGAAWMARANGRADAVSIPTDLATDADPITVRTLRHLHLTRLRFDFRCAAIEAVVPEDCSGLDPYVRALAVFAELGQSRPSGVAAMRRLLDDPEAGHESRVLHTVLHGLWLGEDLPEQAELMLEVLNRLPLNRGGEPIALYREARARRKLRQFDRALAAVNRAFDLLEPGRLDVHEDLVRERGLITLARDLQAAGQGGTGLSAKANSASPLGGWCGS